MGCEASFEVKPLIKAVELAMILQTLPFLAFLIATQIQIGAAGQVFPGDHTIWSSPVLNYLLDCGFLRRRTARNSMYGIYEKDVVKKGVKRFQKEAGEKVTGKVEDVMKFAKSGKCKYHGRYFFSNKGDYSDYATMIPHNQGAGGAGGDGGFGGAAGAPGAPGSQTKFEGDYNDYVTMILHNQGVGGAGGVGG